MTVHTVPRTSAETALIAQLAARVSANPAQGEARRAFEKAGLPHRRVEAWHYTDLRARLREALPLAAVPDAAAIARAKERLRAPMFGDRLVVLDGVYQPALSTLASTHSGLGVAPLVAGDAGLLSPAAQADAMVALNIAMGQGGLRIDIAPGAKLDAPIEIVHLHSGRADAATHARIDIALGAGAQASFVAWRGVLGSAPVQINDVLRLTLADGAQCDFVTSIDERVGHDALAVLTLDMELGARARLNDVALVKGGETLRRQIFASLKGEHTKLNLGGVALLRGTQHADTTLVVEHAAAHCDSREFFRHIVDGEATGVFQGKIVVRPGAQKTDGVMRSNALLLSEAAAMMNKPELEIFADDVVCGHGATCGELDENQLFYLMARGLPRAEAEGLLLQAFAGEVIEAVDNETLREAMIASIEQWLGARGRT